MPKIRLNSEALQAKAKEVEQYQQEQQEIISSVAKLVDEIVSDWQGKAQEAFIAAFEAARPTYEKFAPDLSDFAHFLTNYAQTNEYLDVAGGRDIAGA